MSAADYILRLSVLALLGAYLLHKQRDRELARATAQLSTPKRPLPDWNGKTVDTKPLITAAEEARRHQFSTRSAPSLQPHYKRALLALARVSAEKFSYFDSLRPDQH